MSLNIVQKRRAKKNSRIHSALKKLIPIKLCLYRLMAIFDIKKVLVGYYFYFKTD